MGAELLELLPTLGGLSGVGTLVAVAVWGMLRSSSADRSELRDERTRLDGAQNALDAERKLRRQAEDREAELARQVAGLTARIDELAAEVARLRSQLGAR